MKLPSLAKNDLTCGEHEAALLCLPGEHELMALPSVMVLPYFPLLKRLQKRQQGRNSRENKIFLPLIFEFQVIV